MDLTRRLRPTHLRLFQRIAEMGQLQTAADALGMSQPAASRILAEVEKQAGAPLFFRTPKGMEPTPIGLAVVRHARVVLSELDNLEKEVRNLRAGHAGEVRIGSVTGAAVGILMPVIQQARAASPDLDTTIEVGPSTELVRGLDEGRFDFILSRLPTAQDSRDLLTHPARTEIVRLIVRDSHPLAQRDTISLAETRDFDWVMQERGSPIRDAVEHAFHLDSQPTPDRVINSSSMLVVLQLLATSDAISPQSDEVAALLTGQEFGARLIRLDIRAPMTVTPYFVVRHRSRQLSRAAQAIYEQVLRRL